MQFTEAEKRFLHREHLAARLGKLLTLDEFRELGCPDSVAVPVIQSQLEGRARKLGPKFEAERKRLLSEPPKYDDDLVSKIAAAELF